jgi:hypothetical protein
MKTAPAGSKHQIQAQQKDVLTKNEVRPNDGELVKWGGGGNKLCNRKARRIGIRKGERNKNNASAYM